MITLYSLLRDYAADMKSANINVRQFLFFISQYAAKKQNEQPELEKWATNPEAEFKDRITTLVENGKCHFLEDGKDGNLFLPDFCREIIKSAYQNPDKQAGIPFPNAANMNLKLPDGFAKTIGLLSDMDSFFRHNDSDSNPDSDSADSDAIINLQFPQDYGSALILESMLPRKLMELALIKIQFFLNNGHNMAHIVNSLNMQIKDKEKALKDCINRVIYRPLDCINDMERLDDFVYLFWVHLCALVKKDINDRNEIRDTDLAVLQSVYVIEVCSSLYRSAVVKKHEIDAAYARLEELMGIPPYRYTLGDIAKFATDKGVPLLNYISKQGMESYIRRKITESKDGALPAWLSIQGTLDEHLYFKKEQYLPLCSMMIGEAQPQVKTALIRRWSRLIKDYSSEPAMENDPDYDKLLKKLTNTVNPVLSTMLEDPKLLWAYNEMERSLGLVPQGMRLFNRGMLLPFFILYALGRREIIADIKSALPFWYSNPVFHAIFKFFKNLIRKKSTYSPAEGGESSIVSGKSRDKMQISALRIQSDIVPEGQTADEYLESLEERWCSLRDENTRKTLIIGLKALLRDTLRYNIRIKNLKWIKRDNLREITNHLISHNKTLSKLKDRDALRLYMELYMLKLLLR